MSLFYKIYSLQFIYITDLQFIFLNMVKKIKIKTIYKKIVGNNLLYILFSCNFTGENVIFQYFCRFSFTEKILFYRFSF